MNFNQGSNLPGGWGFLVTTCSNCLLISTKLNLVWIEQFLQHFWPYIMSPLPHNDIDYANDYNWPSWNISGDLKLKFGVLPD